MVLEIVGTHPHAIQVLRPLCLSWGKNYADRDEIDKLKTEARLCISHFYSKIKAKSHKDYSQENRTNSSHLIKERNRLNQTNGLTVLKWCNGLCDAFPLGHKSKTVGSLQHYYMGLTLDSRMYPNFIFWFLKIVEVGSWIRTTYIWQESDATFTPLHLLILWTWVQNCSLNQLESFCFSLSLLLMGHKCEPTLTSVSNYGKSKGWLTSRLHEMMGIESTEAIWGWCPNT